MTARVPAEQVDDAARPETARSPGKRRASDPLKPGRRAFLSGLLWASLAFRRPKAAFAQNVADPLDAESLAALEAVADTIVPRDGDPGALDAGVPARILVRLANDRTARTLYRAGLQLLDRLAQQVGASSFSALDAPGRERILSSLASGATGPRDLGGAFFLRAKRDVLRYYWASTVGQRVVGYRPPIAGYPEYADPPAGTPRPPQ